MSSRDHILEVCRGRSVGEGPRALAVDLGGTFTKAGLIDEAGAVVDALVLPTPVGGENAAERVIDQVALCLAEFESAHEKGSVEAVSFIAPGLVDEARGVGVFSANLGWREVPFAERLRARLGMPISMAHDVRAAGAAEFAFAESPVADSAMFLALGTGLAAAIRIGGKVVSNGGYAGEIGFSRVYVETADGHYLGYLERISSAAAIARRYTERSGNRASGSLDVLRAMRAGDQDAADVWNEAVDALAFGCEAMVSSMGIEEIVLGGGLSEATELVPQLESALDDRLTFQRKPVVRRAVLSSVAGLLGAAMQTRHGPDAKGDDLYV